MPPEPDDTVSALPELQLLREEHALLGELLRVDRTALRNFMSYAARTLTRVRAQLQRRTPERAQFHRKLARLHALYATLAQRATPLAMQTLAAQLQETVAALAAALAVPQPSGDGLLPALERSDALFLTLTNIAGRTGIPLAARRAPRRQGRLPGFAISAAAGNSQASKPQLVLALQQLALQQGEEQCKSVELSTSGLEQVPEAHVGAFYDMLSQMLRNAIEHGIETPAQRRAAGKSAQGTVLIEFQQRHGGHFELIFQDDGQGLNAERIIQAAVHGGLIAVDAQLEQDRRRASTLIFHAGLSTAENPGGRGFGMRILRDHVKRLQGQIQVATKRGQFTRIRIRLPVQNSLSIRRVAAQA